MGVFCTTNGVKGVPVSLVHDKEEEGRRQTEDAEANKVDKVFEVEVHQNGQNGVATVWARFGLLCGQRRRSILPVGKQVGAW